jgi:hypothetical protein
MTAATQAPARPVRARASRLAPPLSFLRLLRIELRRNAMPWLLPLIAALFWFDSYRPSTGQPPLYVLRTFWNMGQGHTFIDFGPFVAGVAAWMGSRDGRRRTADLVTGTARPRWTAQLATWGATAIWAIGGYLVFTGVMFAVYAHQGVQGQPPWWWVAVGATAVAAFSAAGFAVGVFWPSRFAAPLAAFGGFLALIMSSQTGFHDNTGWALILPTNSNGNFQADSACATAATGRGCAGSRSPSPRPGSRPRAPRWAWSPPPGCRRMASSSPRCTTRPATGRSATPRSAARPPGSRCA